MNMKNPKPLFMSIPEIARTGLLREYTLRRLVKNNQIPCIYSGNRCLINYSLLLEYLNQGGITNDTIESD